MPVYQLSKDLWFPPVEEAEEGIIAVGGDLSVERLLMAYESGIFPWYGPEDPIIWWSPDPRFVLYPRKLKVSKSMKQLFKKQRFSVSLNKCFEKVLKNCASVSRVNQMSETWLNNELISSFVQLHERNHAISVEVWEEEELVGGLYGMIIGKVFSGESMFYKRSNASKYGFIALVNYLKNKGLEMIDCQTHSKHLESLGGEMLSRSKFIKVLEKNKALNNLIDNKVYLLK